MSWINNTGTRLLAGLVIGCGLAVASFLTVFFFPWFGSDTVRQTAPWFTTIPALGLGGVALVVSTYNANLWLKPTGGVVANRLKTSAILFLLIVGAYAAYILNSGLRPQTFEITWSEELRINESRTINLQIKRVYERTGFRINEYRNAIFRRNEMRFDAGEPEGQVVISSPLRFYYVNQIEGIWYIVLSDYQGAAESLGKDAPGGELNTKAQRLATIKDGKLVWLPWASAPKAIRMTNLFFTSAPPEEVAAVLRDHRVTLEMKRAIALHPYHPNDRDDFKITRPYNQPSE